MLKIKAGENEKENSSNQDDQYIEFNVLYAYSI